jgi:hypothetical protein
VELVDDALSQMSRVTSVSGSSSRSFANADVSM